MGNAFLDTAFPGVWMEDWAETYDAISAYDISNNYWVDGETSLPRVRTTVLPANLPLRIIRMQMPILVTKARRV